MRRLRAGLAAARSATALGPALAAALAALLAAGPVGARAAGTLTVSHRGPGQVSGSGILCPPACTQSFPRRSQFLTGFGHSDATDYGAATPSLSWPALLAGDLHATSINRAVIGAVASYPDGPKYAGGWAWVLQHWQPGTNPAAAPLAFTATLLYGFNDIVVLGGPSHLGPFNQALITMISRLDAVAAFNHASPTVSAPAGAWTTVPAGEVASGTTLLRPDRPGASLTIRVPRAFRGGTIDLGFTSTSSTNPPSGQAIYAVRVDGGPPDDYVIDGPTMVTPYIGYGGGFNGTVDAVPGLSPGAHTITVSLRSTAATIVSYFDYWEAEATQPAARPIVLALQYPLTPQGFALLAGTPYIPDNAALAALDADIRSLAAGFGPNVLPVQLNLGSDPANFYTDHAHPSTAGHALIAQQLLAGLTSETLSATPSPGGRFLGWQGGGCAGRGRCTLTLNRDRAVTARFSG